jgi:uncharacterized protein YjiS (DUF1127 family)
MPFEYPLSHPSVVAPVVMPAAAPRPTRLARLWTHIVAVWRARREAAYFASLDDHLLRDIGMTRTEIVRARQQQRWLPIIMR